MRQRGCVRDFPGSERSDCAARHTGVFYRCEQMLGPAISMGEAASVRHAFQRSLGPPRLLTTSAAC